MSRRQKWTYDAPLTHVLGIASLETLMVDFAKHYHNAPTPPGFVPKAQDLVSAKFSDGQWYRAKVRRVSPAKREAEVTFIDYGNRSTVPFSDTRPLDPRFKALPGQAYDARLRYVPCGVCALDWLCALRAGEHYADTVVLIGSFVKLVAPTSEYYDEAIDRFKAVCEGRKLVATIDYKEGSVLHLRLIDPADPASANGNTSVNVDLVRDGYASIDRRGTARYASSYPAINKQLAEALKVAKRERAGMFEFGDVEEDD